MREKQPNSIIEKFRTASRQYSDASIFMHEAIARKAGLSGADHKYLGLILQHKELTAGEIAKLTGLTTGAVTGLIDRWLTFAVPLWSSLVIYFCWIILSVAPCDFYSVQ